MERAKTVLLALMAALAALVVMGVVVWFLVPHGGEARKVEGAREGSGRDAANAGIWGTVRDEKGRPIEGVFVGEGTSPFAVQQSFCHAYAGSDGTYALEKVKAGEVVVVTATAEGYSPALFVGQAKAGNEPVDLVMGPGHTLRLHFVDTRGHPVANVVAEPMRWRGYDVLRSQSVAEHRNGRLGGLVSDDHGNIAWGSAPADGVDLSYSVWERETHFQRGDGTFTAGEKPIEIVMKDAFVITATVTDAKTHEPIPAFKFFIGNGDTAEKATDWDLAQRGENGAFRYRDGEPFDYAFVRVEAPGYPPVVTSAARSKGEAMFSFEMSAAGGIPVKVVTEDKEPAVNAKVYTITQPVYLDFEGDAARPWSSENSFQTTDDEGRVVLADPGKDGTRVVVLAAEGFAEISTGALRKEGTITLEPWATLTLHVQDGERALGLAEIDVEAELEGREPGPAVELRFQKKTSEDGDVMFVRVPPREMTISYRMTTVGSEAHQQGVDLPLRKLTPKGDETLDLGLDRSGQWVEGRLVRPAGMGAEAGFFDLGEIGPPAAPSLYTPAELAEFKKLPVEGDARKRWNEEFFKSHPERVQAYIKMRDAWFASHAPEVAYFVANAGGTFTARQVVAGDRTLRISLLDAVTGKALARYRYDFKVPEKVTSSPMELGDIAPLPADSK